MENNDIIENLRRSAVYTTKSLEAEGHGISERSIFRFVEIAKKHNNYAIN